jgi:nucleotide-binding universal stress UspA family protein
MAGEANPSLPREKACFDFLRGYQNLIRYFKIWRQIIMGVNGNKVLLAVDGSDQSLYAVRYVSKMLPVKGVDLVLFHVSREVKDAFWDLGVNPALHSKVGQIRAWDLTRKKQIQAFMDKSSKIFLDAGFDQKSIKVNIHNCKDSVARDIIKESGRGYNAVVVGRKGISQVKDIVFGNVALKLIEKETHIPVCLVGGTPWTGKILLALDSSKGALNAVDFVGTMWGGSNFDVTLLSVIRSLMSIFQPGLEDLFSAEQGAVLEQARADMEPVFNEAKARLTNAGFDSLRISSRLVTDVGSRAAAIVEDARHGGYGTIVIGRRGLSKLEDFFMGRVSNKVVNLAKEMAVWIVN